MEIKYRSIALPRFFAPQLDILRSDRAEWIQYLDVHSIEITIESITEEKNERRKRKDNEGGNKTGRDSGRWLASAGTSRMRRVEPEIRLVPVTKFAPNITRVVVNQAQRFIAILIPRFANEIRVNIISVASTGSRSGIIVRSLKNATIAGVR